VDISMMKALTCLIIALAAASAQARAADAVDDSGALSVGVEQARKMCFQDVLQVTGTLSAREEVAVSADREGLKVSAQLADVQDQVTTGQILARLEPMDRSDPAATAVVLRSPVAGVVLASAISVGMPVSPRQGPLYRIIAGGDLELQADIAPQDLDRVANNQAVTIRPLGSGEKAGKITRVIQDVDPASQTGRIVIGLTDSRAELVGTFARAFISVGERCGIGAPYSGVAYKPDGTIIFVVRDNHVEARLVSLGLMSGGLVEIRSGLSEGDDVITRSAPFLRDGELVKPIKVSR
jgi:HlyD family secretion protein